MEGERGGGAHGKTWLAHLCELCSIAGGDGGQIQGSNKILGLKKIHSFYI
jgi:hypothetical protein